VAPLIEAIKELDVPADADALWNFRDFEVVAASRSSRSPGLYVATGKRQPGARRSDLLADATVVTQGPFYRYAHASP
jgi:hypothetical protein